MATQAAARHRSEPGARPLLGALAFIGDTWVLAFQALAAVLRGRFSVRHTIAQMAAIGVDSLPIVLVTTFSTGAVFAFYTADVFMRYGGLIFVGGTLTLSFFLELGPILAGVMVAARSGAAISAEIGSMVVTEQVDALRSLAVSPVSYLVAPRVVACVVMLPLVAVFADVAGVAGSYMMSVSHGVPPQAFLESARSYVTVSDLLRGLVKTLWFGFTISIVACHQGLTTSRGAVGVGHSTTRSVVLCVVLIFISDFFLAQVLSGAGVLAQQ